MDLEDIQGIQLPEELPYSPLEAPLLSPPSSAPSEQVIKPLKNTIKNKKIPDNTK